MGRVDAPAPLIIIRQAPTGAAAAALWLSGEEGKGASRGAPDDFAGISRGPDARRELEDLVRGWLAQHPGARIESEIELDLGRGLEAAEKVAPPVPPADTPKSRYPDWLAPGKQVRRSDRDTDNTGTVVACHGQYNKLCPLEEAPGSEPQAAAAPAAPQGAGTFSAAFPVSRIRVEHNVRRHFDEEKLQELADSIRTVGILEPLVLRPLGDNPAADCALIAGERRLCAAKIAGLTAVPAIIRPMSREQALELQVTENVQREDLTPVEEAEAYAMLVRELGWTQARVAERFGKSAAHISERLSLLEIRIPEVIQAVEAGQLSVRAATLLRPWMPDDPAVEPGAIVIKAARTMASEQWPAASAGIRLERDLWNESRALRQGEYYAHFDLVGCTGCPYNVKLGKYGAESHCIHPPCWNSKQSKADAVARKVEEQRKAEHEQRKAAQAKAAAEKAVARVVGAAPASPSPGEIAPSDTAGADAGERRRELEPGNIAAVALDIHDICRRIGASRAEKGDYKRLDDMLRGLGFENEAALEAWLGCGQRVPVKSLQVGRFAGFLAEIVAARAAGQDLATFTRVKVAETRERKAATLAITAPPLPDLSPERLPHVRQWRSDVEQYLRPSTRERGWFTDPDYERECLLPVRDVLGYWEARQTLGASHMPKQTGASTHIILRLATMHDHRVQLEGNDGQHGSVRLGAGRIYLSVGYYGLGAIEGPEPEGPIYYRVQMKHGGIGWDICEVLVFDLAFGEILIAGFGHATIRKDLIPKWWEITNRLPALPTPEGEERSDAQEEQERELSTGAYR